MSEAKRPAPASRGGKKRVRRPEKDSAAASPENTPVAEEPAAPEASKWEPTPAEPAPVAREEVRKEMNEPPSTYADEGEGDGPHPESRGAQRETERDRDSGRNPRDDEREQGARDDWERGDRGREDREFDDRNRGRRDSRGSERDYRDEDRDDRDDRDLDREDDRDYDDRRSDGGGREPRGSDRLDLQPRIPPPSSRRDNAPGGSAKPSDEYAFQIYYDRGARVFTGGVLEFPEIKVTGYDRQEVLDGLAVKLEQHLRNSRDRAPEAFFSRRYPERLEVRISAALFRRLDLCSRQEKVPLDQLVSEMLAGALERRQDSSGRGQHSHHNQHHNQHHHHQGGRPQHHHQQSGGQRRGGGGGGSGGGGQQQQRQPRGKAYQDTMNNRENFMEYVRNLEKSGGGAGEGRWRKK